MDRLIRFLEPAAGPLDPGRGRDRYRGALLGLAVGNALGVPVEGFSAARIRQLLPEGVREIEPQESGRPWDDDVAQAIELAHCLLADAFDSEDYLSRLVAWLAAGGRGIGRQTYLVLSRAAGGAGSEAAREVWEASGRQAAGNGAVMRCAPVALRWRREPERLLVTAQESARATHFDPRCVWTTVTVCCLAAQALAGTDWSSDELGAALAEAGAPREVVDAFDRTTTAGLAELELDEPSSMGYTIKTMSAGLWAILRAISFDTTLLDVVNAGGDSDTNGAVAGALLGARFGGEAIPERWYRRLRDPDALIALADRLWEHAERPETQGTQPDM